MLTVGMQLGDIQIDGDATFVVMADANGNLLPVDCTVITASVIAAVLRTIRGIHVEPKPVKRSRGHTAYNRYVSKVLKEIGDIHPEWSRKQRMTFATTSWAEEKKKMAPGPIRVHVTHNHES